MLLLLSWRLNSYIPAIGLSLLQFRFTQRLNSYIPVIGFLLLLLFHFPLRINSYIPVIGLLLLLFRFTQRLNSYIPVIGFLLLLLFHFTWRLNSYIPVIGLSLLLLFHFTQRLTCCILFPFQNFWITQWYISPWSLTPILFYICFFKFEAHPLEIASKVCIGTCNYLLHAFSHMHVSYNMHFSIFVYAGLSLSLIIQVHLIDKILVT